MELELGPVVRALVIKPGADGELVDVEPVGQYLQALVGGWLEGVSPPLEAGWHAYCDEEGKLKGLPMNFLATAMAKHGGWRGGDDILCGPVVFLGNGPDGEEADVPEEMYQLCAQVIILRNE